MCSLKTCFRHLQNKGENQREVLVIGRERVSEAGVMHSAYQGQDI